MNEATNASAGCATSSRRRALLAQAPVDDDPDAVGQRGGVAEVVGDDQRRQRQGGEDVLQLAAHDAARVGVERRERLVEQQDPRVARQGARDAPRAGARRRRARPGARRPGARSARARAARHARVARARRRRRCARTVMCGNSAYSWKTRPTERRSGGRSTLALGVEPRAVAERDAPAVGPPQARRSRAGPSSCRRPRARRARRSRDPMLRLTPSSNERRATAMSSSSVSTRRGSCTRAAPRR